MNVNPILPGFYPDPTICRAGDGYYLAASTFEYFPGVPVFHSTDLIHWEQIGNALDRPEQLRVLGGLAAASTGVYAPTLRHREGKFWLVTTNVLEHAKGQLIVHSTDPAKGWSDPVYAPGAIGIDPDLAWDEDGTCHLTWAGAGGITQAAVDPETGELLSEPKSLWSGTGLAYPEAPHLYSRNGWWYLVIAEGGTERGHAVSVARSRSITGPFEPHPDNPILSHRSTGHPVQNTGHADLVELLDGSWAMVHLGVRPRGSTPMFHVNGRETFLAGVDWIDDWPAVNEDAFSVPATQTSFTDDFADPVLHPRWISPGAVPGAFARRHGRNGVTLAAGRAPDEREARRLLAVRARDARWEAAATVSSGDVALVVRIDDDHWAGVQRHGDVVTARAVVGPFDQTFAAAHGIPEDRPLVIRSVDNADMPSPHNGPDRLRLGYLADDGFQALADIDGRYISTEVASGFTGRVIGVEALAVEAVLTTFTYTAIAEPTG
ncbi:glycoside hydrolase family 43 protein [Yinghuangia soli]|uniref:Glycoside hydrolase family 43 protein n=1 Tax=Yinghuangia soli TaxID=2908204 RepID=A0AA41Q6A0_9ACTN|nr:glycoside hydrolase family 43 protein [Yinghuangia soli]MCF2531129.1 glycoside hydrolase family 43 protein [Yinghuangia soli]